RAHPRARPRAVVGDALQGIGFVKNLETFFGGRERYRMRRVRASVGHTAPDLAHDVLAPGEHGNRVAIPQRLREGAQVRLDAVQLLDAAAGHAETGLDLVDQ